MQREQRWRPAAAQSPSLPSTDSCPPASANPIHRVPELSARVATVSVFARWKRLEAASMQGTALLCWATQGRDTHQRAQASQWRMAVRSMPLEGKDTRAIQQWRRKRAASASGLECSCVALPSAAAAHVQSTPELMSDAAPAIHQQSNAAASDAAFAPQAAAARQSQLHCDTAHACTCCVRIHS